MPPISNVERDYLTVNLVKNKLGEFFDLEPTKLNYCVGPYDPRVLGDLFEFRDGLKEQLVQSLDDLSDQDFKSLCGRSDNEDQVLVDWWKLHLTDEIASLLKRKPMAIKVGWGHPSFEPDYLYWSQMPEFSFHEALMLSVGCEPEVYSAEQVAKMTEEKRLWPALHFLVRRRDLLRRYFASTGYGYHPISLTAFADLIDKIDLEVPPKLLQYFQRRLPKQSPSGNEAPDEPEPRLWKLERASLLKLVAAMSCEQYSYDPNQTKNVAVTSIRDDLDSVGVSMDPKTIRKWLSEAAELVPSEYWER